MTAYCTFSVEDNPEFCEVEVRVSEGKHLYYTFYPRLMQLYLMSPCCSANLVPDQEGDVRDCSACGRTAPITKPVVMFMDEPNRGRERMMELLEELGVEPLTCVLLVSELVESLTCLAASVKRDWWVTPETAKAALLRAIEALNAS